MRTGRRPLFFLITALVCFALIPANDPEFRWVNYSIGGLALLWSVLLFLEVAAGRQRGERSTGL